MSYKTCPNCGGLLSPMSGLCGLCSGAGHVLNNEASSNLPSGNSANAAANLSGQRLSVKDSASNYLLEVSLMLITLLVGGLIWSFILAPRGQSPALQVRGMNFVNARRSQASVSWAKIAARQTIQFLMLFYLVSGLIVGFQKILPIGTFIFATKVMPAIVLAILILDFLFIFLGSRSRLIDKLLGLAIGSGSTSNNASLSRKGF